MLIDTHSHLNFKAYDNDRDEVIKRLEQEGVVCIDVGTKYETSMRAVELAEKYQGIYAAVGMHPIFAAAELQKIRTDPGEGEFLIKEESFDKAKYKELAKSKKVVALGEIGLDYYYKPKTKTRLEQFKQRIAVYYHLATLNHEETKEYIHHRLKIASVNAHVKIFSPEAIDLIYAYSKGVPRIINLTCDSALLSGYIMDTKCIEETTIKEVIKERQLESSVTDLACTENQDASYCVKH